jgi:hypothetical protein
MNTLMGIALKFFKSALKEDEGKKNEERLHLTIHPTFVISSTYAVHLANNTPSTPNISKVILDTLEARLENCANEVITKITCSFEVVHVDGMYFIFYIL